MIIRSEEQEMKIEELLQAKKNTYPEINNEDGEYIVSIGDDGRIQVEVVNIKVIGQSSTGITRPKIVLINDKRKGFMKDSSKHDDSDDLEIVTNYLGNMFGLPMAKESRVFDNNLKKKALLSISVTQEEGERFTEIHDVMTSAVESVKKGIIPMQEWMKDWIKLNSQLAFPEVPESHEFYCADEKDIAIQLPLYVLESCHPSEKHELEKFAKNYFSMLIFDIFIGQTDRNMTNYGLIYSDNTYSFAPLFDNSTLAKPYLPEKLYSLNKVLIDREELLARLVSNYSTYVIDLIHTITNLYEENESKIFEMIDMWIDNHNKELIKRNVVTAYELFKKYN